MISVLIPSEREWQFEYIDHDREIARAIVFDTAETAWKKEKNSSPPLEESSKKN